MAETSEDAIITKDLDGIITSWNKGAERIFGYEAYEMIGKPINLLIPPDRPDEEPSILARLRKGQRIEHYETVRRRKDGELIEIDCRPSDAIALAVTANVPIYVAEDVLEEASGESP